MKSSHCETITKPKLILPFDEPQETLTAKIARYYGYAYQCFQTRFQQTILMITHNHNLTASVDQVFRVSDEIVPHRFGRHNEWKIILNLFPYLQVHLSIVKIIDPYLYACSIFSYGYVWSCWYVLTKKLLKEGNADKASLAFIRLLTDTNIVFISAVQVEVSAGIFLLFLLTQGIP